jgi:hypothetical protein
MLSEGTADSTFQIVIWPETSIRAHQQIHGDGIHFLNAS